MLVEIKCPNCDGKGYHTDYTGNCKDNSNECCGGCEKEYECEHCQGSGLLDVDPNDYFEEEYEVLGVAILGFYTSLKNQGVDENIIKTLILKIRNEIV
jgi:collagenase-like PrtC family protease